MTDFISREDALNFETKITAAPSEIQAISQGMSLYAEHIKSIPAADVVEVVHAEWVAWFPGDIALIMTEEDLLWECSHCKAKHAERSNYCANCGARMDMDGEAQG